MAENRKKLSPFQAAIAAGDLTYHGRSCKNCAGTEKYTSSGQCTVCKAARGRVEDRAAHRAADVASGRNAARKRRQRTKQTPAERKAASAYDRNVYNRGASVLKPRKQVIIETIPVYQRCIDLTRLTGIEHVADHVIPLVMGPDAGSYHDASNLAPIPRHENGRKAAHEWQITQAMIMAGTLSPTRQAVERWADQLADILEDEDSPFVGAARDEAEALVENAVAVQFDPDDVDVYRLGELVSANDMPAPAEEEQEEHVDAPLQSEPLQHRKAEAVRSRVQTRAR